MPDLVRELLDAVTPPPSAPVLPWAVVSQTSPLKVTFPGDTASVPVSPMASYSAPAVGDRVVLCRVGASFVVLGRL